MLPSPSLLALVALKPCKGCRHRPSSARRAQTHIHLIEPPMRCWSGQSGDQRLGQSRKILAAGQRFRAIRLRRHIRIKNQNHVEIRLRIQLTSTERAHGENGAIGPRNMSKFKCEILMHKIKDRRQNRLCQLRIMACGVLGCDQPL